MEKVWLRHYDPGVPATLDYPPVPLFRLLERSAERFPDRIATSFFGATMTYRELDQAANRFARVQRSDQHVLDKRTLPRARDAGDHGQIP